MMVNIVKGWKVVLVMMVLVLDNLMKLMMEVIVVDLMICMLNFIVGVIVIWKVCGSMM